MTHHTRQSMAITAAMMIESCQAIVFSVFCSSRSWANCRGIAAAMSWTTPYVRISSFSFSSMGSSSSSTLLAVFSLSIFIQSYPFPEILTRCAARSHSPRARNDPAIPGLPGWESLTGRGQRESMLFPRAALALNSNSFPAVVFTFSPDPCGAFRRD